jgi:hypothetical protein
VVNGSVGTQNLRDPGFDRSQIPEMAIVVIAALRRLSHEIVELALLKMAPAQGGRA